MKHLYLVGMLLMCQGLCAAQIDTTAIQQVIEKAAEKKQIPGVLLSISDGQQTWSTAAGKNSRSNAYFLASTTKLYTTAVIMKLRSEGKLSLDDKVSQYVKNPWTIVAFIGDVTIKQLLSQTSGLPDYFEGKRPNGVLKDNLTQGKDESFSAIQAIEWAQKMDKSAPGTAKANYSDTNFQLLGMVIEEVTGGSIDSAFEQYIYQPLGLKQTYFFTEDKWEDVAPLYFKESAVKIPMAMESFGADGGLVSTLDESMKFVQGFFTGQLFPEAYLAEMKDWKKMFFPFEYGVGMAKAKIPATPEMYGHPGASGAFAYYCPEKEVYITGTINQIDDPEIPYKLLAKIIANID